MDPNRSSSRGFSLVELMIVLVIFGVLVGMGIPSYQKYSASQKLRGTAENLVQTVQLQRSRAMTTGQSVVLNFNTGTPPGWTCISQGRANHTNLPNGVLYASASPASLVLTRDGRVNTSGTVVFMNQVGGADTVSVQLSGLALIR